MKIEIKVPPMGESISEATVAALLKPSGSYVKAEEELIELETDKVNQILYAPDAGTVSWSVSLNDKVKAEQVLGTLDTEGKPKGEVKKEVKEAKGDKDKPKGEAPAAEQQKKPEAPPAVSYSPLSDQPVLSAEGPAAGARMSKEQFIAGLNLTAEPAVSAAVPIPGTGERETRKKMSKIRSLIASRMVDVLQQTAMLTTFNEADMTQIIHLREMYKEPFAKKHNVRLGFLSFFVKAVVSGLQAFPSLNAYIDRDEMVMRRYFDISVAVGTERGVITPVVRNCDQLSFAEIECAVESFAKKAREGGLNPADLQGGGFTITNGGVYGSLLSTPIINPPQCAILGMHKIMKRPVVVEDQIAIRQMMYLALSYDHRIVDGKEAVSFLVHLKNCLEDPSRLLIEV